MPSLRLSIDLIASHLAPKLLELPGLLYRTVLASVHLLPASRSAGDTRRWAAFAARSPRVAR